MLGIFLFAYNNKRIYDIPQADFPPALSLLLLLALPVSLEGEREEERTWTKGS